MAISRARPTDGTATLVLSVEAAPAAVDIAVLERGLFAYEEARLGNPDHVHYALFARDGSNAVVGGVDCHVMWHRVFVKTLWIAERLRRQGLGRRLMQAAEAEAIRRGCLSMWLTALGDPAHAFYLAEGYSVIGCHEDYAQGHALFSMRKDLAA